MLFSTLTWLLRRRNPAMAAVPPRPDPPRARAAPSPSHVTTATTTTSAPPAPAPAPTGPAELPRDRLRRLLAEGKAHRAATLAEELLVAHSEDTALKVSLAAALMILTRLDEARGIAHRLSLHEPENPAVRDLLTELDAIAAGHHAPPKTWPR